MAEVTQLVLAVDSRQVRTATGDLDRFGRAGAQTERQAASLGRTFKGVGTAVGVVVAALASSEVLRAADAYKLLNSRLQLVSKNTTEFARAQSEVLRISQATRVGLEQTGNLYTQLARSTQGLGVSQQELLGVTESINQALLVSGGNAESAKAALTQLSQAFASGVLRGEEFNSVAEQAPRILQAIADGTGNSIGELRKLAEAGELTSIRVIRALQSQSAVLAAEAQKIPLTVGQATTQAANAFSVLIGAIDESTGATEGLAGAISEVSQFVTELAANIRRANQGAEEVGFLARAFTIVSQTVRILLSDVVFVFKGIGREVTTVAKQLRELPNAIASADFSKFRAISDAAKADAIRARQELDKYQQQVLNPFLNSRGRGTTGGADPRLIGTTPPEETVGFRPRGGGGSGGGGRRTSQREQISEAEKYLQNLRQQLEATVDLSAEEALLRDIQLGRLGKITPAQEQQALALARQIDEFKRLTEAEKAQAEANQQAIEERNRVLEEGRQVYESTRTPLEQLAAETERLNKLLQAGAIDWDTYSRAVFAAQDEFDAIQKKAEETGDGLDNFATIAAERIQGALGDELTKVLEGDFENIGDAFTRVINRMVAEAIAADLAKAIGLGGSSGGGSSGLFGAFGNFFGGLFGAPGRAIGGSVSRGRMYEVNERGRPELLNVGGRQLLLMGNQGGTVNASPSSGGGMNVVNNFNVSGPVDRRTEAQISKAATRGLQRAQRWM